MSERKAYVVIFQDEWNNLDLIGTYGSLDEPELIESVNSFLPDRFRIRPGMIREYASSFGTCFDVRITDLFDDSDGMTEQDLEEVYGYMIRGFILYRKEAEEMAAALIETTEGDDND